MIANHGVLFEHLTAMQEVLCSIPNTDEPNTLKVPKLGLRPPWQTHLLDTPPPHLFASTYYCRRKIQKFSLLLFLCKLSESCKKFNANPCTVHLFNLNNYFYLILVDIDILFTFILYTPFIITNHPKPEIIAVDLYWTCKPKVKLKLEFSRRCFVISISLVRSFQFLLGLT